MQPPLLTDRHMGKDGLNIFFNYVLPYVMLLGLLIFTRWFPGFMRFRVSLCCIRLIHYDARVACLVVFVCLGHLAAYRVASVLGLCIQRASEVLGQLLVQLDCACDK